MRVFTCANTDQSSNHRERFTEIWPSSFPNNFNLYICLSRQRSSIPLSPLVLFVLLLSAFYSTFITSLDKAKFLFHSPIDAVPESLMKLEIHLSGFGCLLEVTNTLALDPMLVSIRSQAALLCLYEVIITSVLGGQPKKHAVSVIKQQNTSNALF